MVGRSGEAGKRVAVAISVTPAFASRSRTSAAVSGSVPGATISVTARPSVTVPSPSVITAGAGKIAGRVAGLA